MGRIKNNKAGYFKKYPALLFSGFNLVVFTSPNLF